MPVTGDTGAIDQRLEQIRRGREHAEAELRRARRRETVAILIGLAATTAATLLAGIPALTTRFVIDGWQLTCGITAVLTATATVASGVRQQLGGPDRLLRSVSLAAKLRWLEYSLMTGRLDAAAADAEFGALLQEYPDLPQPRMPASPRLAVARVER